MTKRQPLYALIFFIVLLASLLASLIFGAEKLPLQVIMGQGSKFQNIILWKIRLPRCLLVLVTGLLLGASGAVFQLFFRNPLAEPGIMGISSGATLGAVIATVILAGKTLPPALEPFFKFISPINLCAFLGALASGFFVTVLAFSRAGKASSIMLLLCGTALGTLYSSISSAILLTSNKELHSIYTWILGSFNGRGWKELIFIAIPSALSIIIAFAVSRPLDLLTCGEKTAASLGVQVDRLRIFVLICGALAVSSAVCAGGTIGFVGLIAPHIVRKITGPKSRTLIPYSMMFGAALLLISDTIARTAIAPGELPAGIITSILGVPFFISLCLTRKNN